MSGPDRIKGLDCLAWVSLNVVILITAIRGALERCWSHLIDVYGDRLYKTDVAPHIPDGDSYFKQRDKLSLREANLGFERACNPRTTPDEELADKILQILKHNDELSIYDSAPSRDGSGGQTHPRFSGDHFLSNRDLIEKTSVFKLATRMPKGSHLHIHFNTNLPANFLLDVAKTMPRMFIKMDRALLLDADYDNCRIQFLIRSIQTEEEDGRTWDVFAADYKTDKWMRLDRFLRKFREHRRSVSVDQWLQGKIVFNEEETHGMLQTAKGAWERFNSRTQMMKGLFNYEKAYRLYVRACLQEFVDQNIQYAEVRVTFMGTNQIWRDDGCGQIDNKGIMELIIDECAAFHPDRYFAGLKIIYCVPRSFSPDQVMHGLEECLEFKLDNKFSRYIAGFDLVGEEEKGKPLKAFIPQFLEFKNKCTAREVSIPFLFHCGETLGVGTDTDGNLLDALLLGSKRIGHGFALARHPYIMEQMKKRNVCVELCPISNEILGLTPRVSGHAMYSLLANNVHCTVNTDNSTIFGSKLSHDFYQVMVGKADMTLYGWRQLAEWSLEHSCMDAKELETARRRWDELWKEFVAWIVEEYGHLVKPPA